MNHKQNFLKNINRKSFFQKYFSDNPKKENARKQIFGAYNNGNGDELNIDVGENDKEEILSYASEFTKNLERKNEDMKYYNKHGGEPSPALGFLSFLGAEAIYFTQIRDTIEDPILKIFAAGAIGMTSYFVGSGLKNLFLDDTLKEWRENKIEENKKKIKYLSNFRDAIE